MIISYFLLDELRLFSELNRRRTASAPRINDGRMRSKVAPIILVGTMVEQRVAAGTVDGMDDVGIADTAW